MRLQSASDHRRMTWANGRGFTDEVIAVPDRGAWDWRLSIAEVNEDGPFSSLPGVERALVVAQGRGMTLFVDGSAVVLSTFEGTRFSGDDDACAVLTRGPVRDLNLMVRRSSGLGVPELEVVQLDAGASCGLSDCVAVIILDGILDAGPNGAEAGRFDVLVPDPGDFDGGVRLLALTASVVTFARLRI